MNKIYKSFTFRFLLLSFFIIFMHQIGQDSKLWVLIGLNPILDHLPREFMSQGPLIACNDVVGYISIYWYIACVLSFIFYGIVADIGKYIINRVRHKDIFKNKRRIIE